MNCKIVVLLVVVLCGAAMIQQISAAIGPQCLLPLEHGPCRALMTKYGYNPETNQCEEFRYGGCPGNENNFDTMELCHEICS